MDRIDPKRELIDELNEMLPILEWDGDVHWQEWLTCCVREIEASDYHGIERLAGGFGGMGSFNDLIVGQRTNSFGPLLWQLGYREMNEKLGALRERAFALLRSIQLDHVFRE